MSAVIGWMRRHRLLLMLLLLALLLAGLFLMSKASQNSARFSEFYSWLLLFSGGGLLLLLALISASLYRLLQRYRRREPGSRLSLRLVVLFVALATAPVAVVYVFSIQFLQRGIDSWFNFRVEQALGDALDLSRSSLDLRMRDVLRQSKRMAVRLRNSDRADAAVQLEQMLNNSEASELTLFAPNGRIIATASVDPLSIVPNQLPEIVLLQVRRGHNYVSLDPIRDVGFHIRAVVLVPGLGAAGDNRILQALYPVPERLGKLADSVQSAFDGYRELAFLRRPLKASFILILSLVLLFGVLAAVWAALYAARRLVAPIRELAEGTRAVAAGEYGKQLPLTRNDELGFLVHSFNQMTRNLTQARAAEHHSQQLVEQQRAYLQAVLARLSSGVLTLDQDGCVHTYNAAAEHILHADLGLLAGSTGSVSDKPHVQQFFALLQEHLGAAGDWRQEITLFAGTGRQVLMCRGSSLATTVGLSGGHVVVFDDITTLVQAQRDAAWAEVARRLAHEIKNPLTPIQLATERIRHKCLRQLPPEQARVLDRGTHTIMQQVTAMKEMVDTFNEYARPPRLKLTALSINRLVNEVMYLYRGHPTGIDIQLKLDPSDPVVQADEGRMRQLVHNLVKNSLEAMAENHGSAMVVSTRRLQHASAEYVELMVGDNGPGFPDGSIGNFFEPYVSTKPKGTGLGLAIVKKIVEEHNGLIELESPAEGGARVVIQLPLASALKAIERVDAKLDSSNSEGAG